MSTIMDCPALVGIGWLKDYYGAIIKACLKLRREAVLHLLE